MGTPIRVLLVEDSEDDALLLVAELRRGGYDLKFERVEAAEALTAALANQTWGLVLCDYNLPQYNALDAIRLVRESGPDIPCIVVSGTTGEETAVETMKAGAHDFILKDNLSRLVPAVERELEEAKGRRARREAEEALRLSNEKIQEMQRYLARLIESSTDAIISTDEEGKVILFNRGAEALLGYLRDEVIGEHVTMLYESKERAKEVMSLMRKGGGIVSAFETTLRARDGSLILVLTSASLLYDEEGREAGTVGFSKDLRELKRTEEQIRKLSRTVEQSPSTVLIADTEGNIEYVNPKFAEVTGYAPEEVIGQNPRILKSGHTPPEEYERLWETITSGGEWHGEFLNKKKSGELYWELASICPIRDREDKVTHFLKVGEVITERKQAEEALRESEERYQDLYDNAPDMFVSIDAETAIILRCNQTLAKKLNYSKEEIIGRPVFDLYHPDCMEDARKAFRSFVETGIVRDAELQMNRKDGSTIDVILNVSAVRDEKGKVLYSRSIWRDITELKQAQALAIASEKLAAVGRLTAGVSHEVLNPLNIITLIIQRLLDEPDIDPKLAEDLRGMHQQANRITKIAQGLLSFSRQRTPERRPIDLNATVRRTLGLLEYDLRLQNIEVEKNLAEGLPPILADEDQIQQVILNLLTNARDVMPKGGRLVLSTAEIEPLFADRERVVELRVEDTGPGIPPGEMDKIFEPFFTTKPVGEGTGLGLSICQGIMESHGGVIWAENVPGGGAAFIIRFSGEGG